MNEYKVTGQFNYKGNWSGIAVTIKCPNEKVARVKATEYMHKIEKVEKA